ncbi:hypothetical protein HDZ31DRAFT_36888 [Schizophyllum fasciatum]
MRLSSLARALLASQAFLLQELPLVHGALYPTRPIRKTALQVGKQEVIKWTDDGRAPHVSQMGPVKIDLYAANNTYLCTLSQAVDPSDRAVAVALPPDLDYSAPRYALHFVPERSRYATVYTADFLIRDTTPAVETDMIPFAATMAPSETVAPHLLTLVLPSTTLTSTLPGIAALPTATHLTVTAPSMQQANTPDEEAREEDGDEDEDAGGSRNVSSVYHPPVKHHEYNSALRGLGWSTSGNIDWERFKFKLVFIVWPAMVGISMAV